MAKMRNVSIRSGTLEATTHEFGVPCTTATTTTKVYVGDEEMKGVQQIVIEPIDPRGNVIAHIKVTLANVDLEPSERETPTPDVDSECL